MGVTKAVGLHARKQLGNWNFLLELFSPDSVLGDLRLEALTLWPLYVSLQALERRRMSCRLPPGRRLLKLPPAGEGRREGGREGEEWSDIEMKGEKVKEAFLIQGIVHDQNNHRSIYCVYRSEQE